MSYRTFFCFLLSLYQPKVKCVFRNRNLVVSTLFPQTDLGIEVGEDDVEDLLDDAADIVKDLALAILQLGQSVDSKYLQQPLGKQLFQIILCISYFISICFSDFTWKKLNIYCKN